MQSNFVPLLFWQRVLPIRPSSDRNDRVVGRKSEVCLVGYTTDTARTDEQTGRQADVCTYVRHTMEDLFECNITCAHARFSLTKIDVSSVSVSPCHTCDVCQALLSPFVGSKIGVVW